MKSTDTKLQRDKTIDLIYEIVCKTTNVHRVQKIQQNKKPNKTTNMARANLNSKYTQQQQRFWSQFVTNHAHNVCLCVAHSRNHSYPYPASNRVNKLYTSNRFDSCECTFSFSMILISCVTQFNAFSLSVCRFFYALSTVFFPLISYLIFGNLHQMKIICHEIWKMFNIFDGSI